MRRANRGRRRGLATIVVLVCLILIAALSASLIRVTASHRAVLRSEETRWQAEWLADSGIGRARARLAASGDYGGETWDIPAEALGGRGKARVEISVGPVKSRPDRREIRVTAEYPRGAEHPVRYHRTLIAESPARTGETR